MKLSTDKKIEVNMEVVCELLCKKFEKLDIDSMKIKHIRVKEFTDKSKSLIFDMETETEEIK